MSVQDLTIQQLALAMREITEVEGVENTKIFSVLLDEDLKKYGVAKEKYDMYGRMSPDTLGVTMGIIRVVGEIGLELAKRVEKLKIEE